MSRKKVNEVACRLANKAVVSLTPAAVNHVPVIEAAARLINPQEFGALVLTLSESIPQLVVGIPVANEASLQVAAT